MIMSVFKTALEVNVTHHDIMTSNNYLLSAQSVAQNHNDALMAFRSIREHHLMFPNKHKILWQKRRAYC